jgi:hypothetical protein
MADRIPWRPAGAGVVGLGTPAGLSAIHPLLGELVFSIEMAIIVTVIATALFGTSELSERAFRLLRWLGNRPEFPALDRATDRK